MGVSHDQSTGEWVGLQDAATELCRYVGDLALAGRRSDFEGIDFATVDWEALIKGEIDE